jgi:hypothetical protein
MLYREIIAVYSEIHTKHINTLYGQNVELLVHTFTTVLLKVNITRRSSEMLISNRLIIHQSPKLSSP